MNADDLRAVREALRRLEQHVHESAWSKEFTAAVVAGSEALERLEAEALEQSKGESDWDWAARARFWRLCIPEPNTGCWLWMGALRPTGYGTTTWGGRQVSAHRLAWELENGPMARELSACHRCDVRWCVNPEHIFPGTHQENIEDATRKGRMGRRPRLRCGRLTAADVATIKAALAAGESQAGLARRYQMSEAAIWNIANGKSWRHVLPKASGQSGGE